MLGNCLQVCLDSSLHVCLHACLQVCLHTCLCACLHICLDQYLLPYQCYQGLPVTHYMLDKCSQACLH